MKLRNKRTGEIEEFEDISRVFKFIGNRNTYTSLAELNTEWEDYEEPKEYWFIRHHTSSVGYAPADNNATAKYRKEIIGNYFETKEEAEKAVEKLKAWKRLKDKGFRFDGWVENHHNLGIIEFSFPIVRESVWDFEKDLDLLFGGEE